MITFITSIKSLTHPFVYLFPKRRSAGITFYHNHYFNMHIHRLSQQCYSLAVYTMLSHVGIVSLMVILVLSKRIQPYLFDSVGAKPYYMYKPHSQYLEDIKDKINYVCFLLYYVTVFVVKSSLSRMPHDGPVHGKAETCSY